VKEEAVDSIQRSLAEKTSLFSLTREDLLKLSSETLDTLAQTLASTRPLTDEERKQLKKQKRLIKNRESAQLSRQRKKVYLEDLEVKVSRLTEENDEIRRSLSSLSEENRRVKEELFYWKHLVMKSNEAPSAPVAQGVSPHSAVPLSLVSGQKKTNGKQNLKMSGLYLLIVLLSFGLFFNSKKDLNLPHGLAPNFTTGALPSSLSSLPSAPHTQLQQLQKLLLPGQQQLDYSQLLLLLQQQMQTTRTDIPQLEPKPAPKKRKLKEEPSSFTSPLTSSLPTCLAPSLAAPAQAEATEIDECTWLMEEEIERGKGGMFSPDSGTTSPIPHEDLAELVSVEMATGIPLLEDERERDREKIKEESKLVEEEDDSTSLFLSSSLLDPNFASISSSHFL
jgi:hypothetical protein